MLTKQQIEEIHEWVDHLEGLWGYYVSTDLPDDEAFQEWENSRTEFHGFLSNLK